MSETKIHDCGIAIEILDEILRNTEGNGNKNYRYNLRERILRKTMVELIKSGGATFLMLRDDEVQKWWSSLVTAASKTVETRKEKWRVYRIKKAVWDKLSEKDRKILNMKQPTEPRGEEVE